MTVVVIVMYGSLAAAVYVVTTGRSAGAMGSKPRRTPVAVIVADVAVVEALVITSYSIHYTKLYE